MKKMFTTYKYYTYALIAAILISSIVLSPAFRPSYAQQNGLNDIDLWASIYNTSAYASGGSGVELTEEGSTISSWDILSSKFLLIEPTIPINDGKRYAIKIKLPQEFYFVTNEFNIPSGIESYEFNKNDDIYANLNGSGVYNVNQYSGEIIYYLSEGVNTTTIQLEIKPDVSLYNNVKNTRLTDVGVNPIDVTLYSIDGSDELTAEKNISISNATSPSTFGSESIWYNGNTFGAISSVNYLKTITLNLNSYVSNGRDYYYYKNTCFEILLPSYQDSNGIKHYLQTDTSTYSSNGFYGTADFAVDDSELETNHIVKTCFNNALFGKTNTVFNMNLSFPTDLTDGDITSYTFTGGKWNFYIEDREGNMQLKSTTNIPNANFTTADGENVTISGNSSNDYMNMPDAAINLGTIYLANKGNQLSNDKYLRVNFDSNNTNKIRVTTFNVPYTRYDRTIPLTYTLVDDDGQSVCFNNLNERVEYDSEGAICEFTYNISVAANRVDNAATYYTLYRGLLPEYQREYYFKTFYYKVGPIKAGSQLWANGSAKSIKGGGNYFGYTFGTSNESIPTTATLIADEFQDKTITINSNLSTTKSLSYDIQKDMVNDVQNTPITINAGESVKISADLVAIQYHYSYLTTMDNLVIALILPEGVSLNEDTIQLSNNTNANIVPDSITTRTVSTNKILYEIKLPSDVRIGYNSESLGAIADGSTLHFSCYLNTSYYMNQQTINLVDIIRMTGINYVNSGNNGTYQATDTYDLNRNGKTTDKISKPVTGSTSSIEIVPTNAELEISDSIKRINDIGSSNETILDDVTESFNYDVKLDCTVGGVLEDFVYFIPIPKKSIGTDTYMVKDKSRFFDTSLQGAAIVSGQDYYNILYTVAEGLNYTTAQGESVVWYTAAELEASEYDYEDVTMIKLTSKNSNLEYGSSTTISLMLKDVESDYDAIAGATDTWSSAGQYKYTFSGRTITQLAPTEGVTVKIGYVHQLPDITLTAAKDMTPLEIGNINEYTTLSSELPEFEYSHNFKITNVEEYNVSLRNKSYILDNINMDGTYANERFAVTVKLNNGNDIDILNSANTNPIDIGTSSANNAPTFTYKLYNANALTDDSQERYIIVTYEAEDGTKLIQKVFINIESAVAEDPVTSIVTGKRYVTFDSTNTSVNISNDSSVTAQFITSYIPSSYSSKIFILSESLPAGASIILLDKVGTNNPTYWYYTTNGSETEISLTDFTKMGTNSDKTYAYPTGSAETGESLLLIIDFSTCTSTLSEDTYGVKLRLVGNGVPDVDSDELSIITKNKRTFNLSINAEEIYYGDDITLTYDMVESLGIETKYSGRKLSLVISPQGSLTDDTNIILNNNLLISNIDGDYIIPLDNVTGTGDDVTFKFDTKILSKISKNILIDAKLIVSATSDAHDPMLGEVVATTSFTLKNKTLKNASLKVTGMNPGRIIKKDKLSNEITVNFDYIPDTNCNVYVEFLEKQGLAYVKATDKINMVNGSSSHTQGTFNVSASSGSNTVTLKLTNQTQVGTYRLLFSVKDNEGNIVTTVPYNIIIEY